MFDPAVWMKLTFIGVGTQTGAGGGNVIVAMQSAKGSLTIVVGAMIGPDDYAAVRAITANITDSEGTANTLLPLFSESIDNAVRIIPQNLTDDATLFTFQSSGLIVLGGQERLKITADALVQNETLTVKISALTTGKPAFSISGTGTPTLTTTYERYT